MFEQLQCTSRFFFLLLHPVSGDNRQGGKVGAFDDGQFVNMLWWLLKYKNNFKLMIYKDVIIVLVQNVES